MIADEKDWKEDSNEIFCSLLRRMIDEKNSLNDEMYNHIELMLEWSKKISNGESLLKMGQKANDVFDSVSYLTMYFKDEFKDIDPKKQEDYYEMLLEMFEKRTFKTPLDNAYDQVEESSKALEESENKYLRLAADFDNYKKRTQKEKSEIISNTKYNTLSDLLDILDDLEMASRQSNDEGVKLIINKINSYISKQGISVIDTSTDFDGDKHESISVIDMGKDNKNKIIDCVKKGYEYDGKILRYPKVVVGA